MIGVAILVHRTDGQKENTRVFVQIHNKCGT